MPAPDTRAPVPPHRLRLGLLLGTWTTTDLRWQEVLATARAAAEVGFDALYATDHLLLPSTNAELKRRAGAEVPEDIEAEPEGYLECFTVLSALAVAVPRLALGPLVACTGYRHPALLTKIAVTLDDISGGRLILGLGAGDSEGERRTFGFPTAEPVGAFEEALRVIRGLFREEELDFQGNRYRLSQARLLPRGPRPQGPPILIGTLDPGPRMRRLVAQYADIWNGWLGYTDASPESAARQLALVEDGCRRHGRDPATLVPTTTVRVAIPGSGYVPGPGERPLVGSPDEMAETLRGHARLGIAEVQVALTLAGPEGVRAFAPVIRELRSAG
jgi:alkanesulfonate monooxygenase SsuD/methylene tetrahydromethanopterin reductase-like flavin-dependent oxidoreductase (luciferase family)